MNRAWKLAASPVSLSGGPDCREIIEFAGEHRQVFAVVPDYIAVDVLEAIRRAYQDGREDGPADPVRADAAVPDGEDPLNWLKMCIQGYDYLLADPQPGLHTWNEALDRGQRRIVAACLALIQHDQEA